MKQIVIRDVKLNGVEMAFHEIDKTIGDYKIAVKVHSHKWKRKIIINENEITWNLYEYSYYYLIDKKIKFQTKKDMAKYLLVSLPTLETKMSKILKRGKIKNHYIEIHETYNLYNGRMDLIKYVFKDRKLNYKINTPVTYDLIDFNGIKLVRKFFEDRLLHTYSFELGKQFL